MRAVAVPVSDKSDDTGASLGSYYSNDHHEAIIYLCSEWIQQRQICKKVLLRVEGAHNVMMMYLKALVGDQYTVHKNVTLAKQNQKNE